MTVSSVAQGAGRRVLAPAVPSAGLIAAVWLFMLVFPLLFLLVRVDDWLDGEERWRELAVRREMLDVMREIQPRLSPAKRLEDGLSGIECRLGFPDAGSGRTWVAADDHPGFDPAKLSERLEAECRRSIGCKPVFLLVAGADGTAPCLRIAPSLMEGAPPRAATMQPVWLSSAGWLERRIWRHTVETDTLKRRWSGPSAARELQVRRNGLLERIFGNDPFDGLRWGMAQPFMRMRPGGGRYLAYANFLASGPKPDAPLLGGYLAVFRIDDIPRRFLLAPLLSRPDGGITPRLVVIPRETRSADALFLECAPPRELLQDWCLGKHVRPFSLKLRWELAAVRHPFRSWQPWLLAGFYLIVFGTGMYVFLRLGGFFLPLRLRGQIALAVGVATVLPLIACSGVMVSYLEYRKDIDRDRQGKMISERLEMLENGLLGYFESVKQRLWQMKEGLTQRTEAGPASVTRYLETVRQRVQAPVVFMITQRGEEYFIAGSGIAAKTRMMAERLGEAVRAMSMRMFLLSGCFGEADLDLPPRSKLWTRRRRAVAANLSLLDVGSMMYLDGREIDPKFSGIGDSIVFQYMIKYPKERGGRLHGLLYAMFRRSDILGMYLQSLERRREAFSDIGNGACVDFAMFATSGMDRTSLEPATVWPRAAAVDRRILELARRALSVPAGATQEMPEAAGGVSRVRAFLEFPGVAVGSVRPVLPSQDIWNDRMLIGGWSLYALFLVAFVTYILTKNFALPLECVGAAGREVAAGRFDVALRLKTGDEFERLAAEFNEMTAGLREREHLARFVSDEVLTTVRGNDAAGLYPGGERRCVGVLFSHIVDFERITANATVDGTFTLLDDILPRMERAIRSNGGSLDKIIGDGVMGVFHPAELPAAVRAGNTALAMKRIIDEANQGRMGGEIEPLRVSVGFVTGNVICGRIGSRSGRLDFTVIGDTVNLAARLEAESRRRSGSPILVDEETIVTMGAAFRYSLLGTVFVKGRSKPVRMYELVVPEGNA